MKKLSKKLLSILSLTMFGLLFANAPTTSAETLENENLVKQNIQNMYDSIIYLLKGRGITDFEFILGPNPCSISKINQNYRWQILFKDDNIEINLLKGIIKYICITKRDVVFSKEINISIDINPNSVL